MPPSVLITALTRALPAPLAGLALMMVSALHAPAGAAQEDPDFSTLIYDPVALRLEESSDGNVTAHEISSLPIADTALDVKTVLGRLSPEEGLGDSPPASPDQAIAGYERTIRELEREGGAYENRLVQELLGLGSTYQRLAEHERAIEIFERARHINRINQGLFNLEQSPIIQKEIESHLALGDLTTANEQQEYLFFIHRKAHGSGSPDLLPALTALAEWNIFAFNLRVNPASAAGAPSSGLLENFLAQHLVNAQNLYQAIIRIIHEEAGADDPRLLEMEKRLALTNYFFATNYAHSSTSAYALANGSLVQPSVFDGSFVGSNSMGYRHGRDALERRVKYLRELPEPDRVLLARALVDLGDWLLLFKKRLSGVETYQEAMGQLLDEDEAVRKELFQPAVPTVLPTFIEQRHTREALGIPADLALRYKGHIDVAFILNRYGQPEDVRVLDKTDPTPSVVEGQLIRQISRNVFRPRLYETGPDDQDHVTLRYYFTW